MVELSSIGANTYSASYAGDTFNTAWYAKRLLPVTWQVSYLTCVGTDAVSDGMVDFIQDAGISTDYIARIDGKTAGLYMIHLEEGERSFSYWRSCSAARCLANDPALLDNAMQSAGVIYFSGITLAILPDDGRDNLITALQHARKIGCQIVFDPNLRPALWSNTDIMRLEICRAASVADIILPSYDDEARYFGDTCLADTYKRYQAHGAKLVVVKNSGGEILAADSDGNRYNHIPDLIDNPIDTTAAGDSFNAAFLATYLTGSNIEASLKSGCNQSAKTIQNRGALVNVL